MLDHKNKYIIFGAGYEGKNILNALGHDRIRFFCDNRFRGEIDGIQTISFDELKKIHKDHSVILGVQKKEAKEQISNQLKSAGISFIQPSEAYDIEGVDKVKIKHNSELDFWKKAAVIGQNRKSTDDMYRNFILSIADLDSEESFAGKVVADFGCGPRGSLNWLRTSAINFGIDVLASQYVNEFGEEIIRQRMIYVTSGEKYIPIPDNTVDCLITMNSLDHVSDLDAMCNEIIRIMKPEAMLIGSFNLFESPTACEPQTLTEELLSESLLKCFKILNYRLAYMGEDNPYKDMFAGKYADKPDGSRPCVLWVSAQKK